jgi:hypothetical protein
MEFATTASLLDIPNDKIQAGIVAARAVASRLYVPRDMSAGAAKLLRYLLTTVAGHLELDIEIHRRRAFIRSLML